MQTHNDLVDEFFRELGFTVWHYIGFIIAGVSGIAFFWLMDRLAFGWSLFLIAVMAAGILPMLVPYLRTSQLGQFEPIRGHLALSWTVLIPTKVIRRNHPWLLPLWIIVIVGYNASFFAVLVRFALSR